MYFAEHLDAFERLDINANTSLEAACIEAMVESQRLLLSPIYCPLDCTSFRQKFSSTMDRIFNVHTSACEQLLRIFRALKTSRVLHISMNTQLTYEPIVL